MDAPEASGDRGELRAGQELGIEGTPAFVIGGQLIPGAVEKARLEHLIDEARSDQS